MPNGTICAEDASAFTAVLAHLKRQHREILDQLDAIRALMVLHPGEATVHTALRQLRASVNLHAAGEENLFFAILRHHRDGRIRRFASFDGGEPDAGLSSFINRWLDREVRPGRPPVCMWYEFDHIALALRRRILREEIEIHPHLIRLLTAPEEESWA